MNPDAISGTQPAQLFVTTEGLTPHTPLEGADNTSLLLSKCRGGLCSFSLLFVITNVIYCRSTIEPSTIASS